MRNRERNQTQSNPDIASTTHDLKAMHAKPAAIPPEANKDKTRRIGHLLPLMLGTGAVAIAAVAGGYFATRGEDSAPNPGDKKPVATATLDPTPTPSETVEQPTPSEAETPNSTTGEVLSQTTSIEAMDSMSIEEYARLPFADRLAYAIAKVGEAYPTGSADSPEDPSTIPGWYWQQALGYATNNASSDERAKLAGSSDYYTTDLQTGLVSEAYQTTIDSVVNNGGEGIGSSTLFIYEDSGELQQGIDRDGNPIEFYNVTYHIEDQVTGEVKPSQTAQAIKTEVMLLDGTSVIFYAQGYGIDGHQSPVEDYPY